MDLTHKCHDGRGTSGDPHTQSQGGGSGRTGGREEREKGESEGGGGMGRRQTKINGRQTGIR